MPDDQKQVLMDILQRLTRLETKVDSMANTNNAAIEALQYGKSAHHRLNDVDDRQKWTWRTIVGGFIAGAIGLFWKGWGN